VFSQLSLLGFAAISDVDIAKALDSTSTTTGNVLIPQDIDRAIPELALLTSPLATQIPETDWGSGTYDQNRRTAFGRSRFVADGNSPPEVNSTYARYAEPLKIVAYKGAVTGFLQYSSQNLLDALAKEAMGGTVSVAQEKEHAFIYANKGADATQFTGLEQYSQNANGMNMVYADGSALSYAHLDSSIDAIQNKGVVLSPTNAVFVMSHKAISFFSRQSGAQGQQRWLDTVEARGGFRFQSYRNIPIVPTSFLSPVAWPGGTVTDRKSVV